MFERKNRNQWTILMNWILQQYYHNQRIYWSGVGEQKNQEYIIVKIWLFLEKNKVKLKTLQTLSDYNWDDDLSAIYLILRGKCSISEKLCEYALVSWWGWNAYSGFNAEG